MPRTRGQLSVFTIAVIFVVVFAGMYSLTEYAERPAPTSDTADSIEESAREAIWEAVNEWRASAGRFDAPRTDSVETAAQETAEQIGPGGLATTVASGIGIPGGPTLPNPGPRCTQLAVPITLPEDAVEDGGSSLSTDATSSLVQQSLAGFQSVDPNGVLERRAWANNGIGVEIQDSTAVVVYRSCMTRRYSP